METNFFATHPEVLSEEEIKLKTRDYDKETLLKIVESLLENNAALRKYIKILESQRKVK